ncbi:Histone acetyltransferase type B subunit 2 [Maudiozyma exigua]|uniref:Histone acetyltransferase type B subunit 2 n=1 Tax=Maudiozyma exigua TaxID=34358 RepID=A0A9P6W8N5_MAUEX|nr:Histone acetyltransferase type B subunit 2 [Kazachstania exigua]
MEALLANANMPEENNEPLTTEQEYELWKTNVPLMYDFVSETKLTWPSLTIQWLPDNKDTPRERQDLILGTHTSGEEDNYLKIASIELPTEIALNSIDNNGNNENENVRSNIRITKKFRHDLEITRARYMPQQSNIVGTINGEGNVFIYDINQSTKQTPSKLSYHKDNGYGLSFNPNDRGKLLSAADDHTIALWDVDHSIEPVVTWDNAHTDIVNDCKWHNFQSNIFGTVSEDKTLQIQDTRILEGSNKDNNDSIIMKINTETPFNTIAFSKHSTNLFAAAGTDSNIYLYDMRDTSSPLHTMCAHTDAVTSLDFYGQEDGIIVSAGADRRVIVWDLMEIGSEQVRDDAEDATPEVLMVHAGHRSAINDISINETIPWLMASAEEENTVQIWKCSSKLQRVGGVPEPDFDMLQ